jgi:hypothetical protein
MLGERDVIDAVCSSIEAQGYEIERRCYGKQRGVDIVAAHKEGHYLRIEAKGEGSETEGTNRFGEKFDSSQLHDHLAKALYRAIREACLNPKDLAGFALPDIPYYEKRLMTILPALRTLNLQVWLVSEDHIVRNLTME